MSIVSDTAKLRARFRLLLLVVLLGLAAGWIWQQDFRTYHFAVVAPGVLYRDGLRSMTEFQTACYKGNIDTVIRLLDPVEQLKEPFTTEQTYCYHSHLHLVDVPVALGGWPTQDQIQIFLQAMDLAKQKHRPALVHCSQGVRRTGMMVAAYQISRLQYTKEQAQAAILTFGHDHKTSDDIRKFIELYDPKTQQLTTMPSSALE